MSTDLVACQNCGEQLSPYVVTCPRCGHCRRNSRKRFRLRLFGDSSKSAGHVLESVYPRQGQQLPPPEPKPPQPPVAKAPEQTPPAPPASPPPSARQPERVSPPAPEPQHADQPPVSDVPRQAQPPAVSHPSSSESQAETKPVANAPQGVPPAQGEPLSAGTTPSEVAASDARTAQRMREQVPSTPATPVEPPVAATPVQSDMKQAEDSPTPPPMAKEENAVGAETTPPVNASESIDAAALPPDSASEEIASEVASREVESRVGPAEKVENQAEAAAPVAADTSGDPPPETKEAGSQDVSEAESESELLEHEESEPEEYSEEEFELPAKTNNARVVLVVVLMIVGAVALKIAVSFF